MTIGRNKVEDRKEFLPLSNPFPAVKRMEKTTVSILTKVVRTYIRTYIPGLDKLTLDKQYKPKPHNP